jgi:multidrug efflux pump subunit AcrA (membrane-fusion protein)
MNKINILLFNIGLVLCNQTFSKEKPIVKAQTIVAKKTEFFDVYQFPTLVRPMQIVNVPSDITGEVVALNVHLGQAVKNAEVLASIKNNDPVFRYQKAQVKAPFDGVVSAIHVVEGSLVSPGTALIEITNPKKIKLTIEIPAAELALIKSSYQGELSFEKNSSHEFNDSKPLNVSLVGTSPNINPVTGTATGELRIMDGQAIPPAGLLGVVAFKGNLHQAIAVPESATFFDAKKSMVGIVRDNVYQSVEVELGTKSRGQVEILKGLNDGDVVVTKLSDFADDGDKIEVEKK